MISLSWSLAVIAGLFCVMVFFIPPEIFRLYANLLEIGVALFCMGCCLQVYRSQPGRVLLLLAAFAFLGFALSNTFWYLYASAFGRMHAFFSVSEMGFLGFLLFFIVAFRIEGEKTPFPHHWQTALAALFAAMAILIIASSGLNPVTALLLLRILIVLVFMGTALEYGMSRYTLLWTGICLFSLASVTYGLRDAFIIRYPAGADAIIVPATSLTVDNFLSIVGPLDVMAFLLILLGIFEYLDIVSDDNKE